MNDISPWDILTFAVKAIQGKGIFSPKFQKEEENRVRVHIKQRKNEYEIVIQTQYSKLLGRVFVDRELQSSRIIQIARNKYQDREHCNALIAALKYVSSGQIGHWRSDTKEIEISIGMIERKNKEIEWNVFFLYIPYRPGSYFIVVEDDRFQYKRIIGGR
jgi:hypothetical protein